MNVYGCTDAYCHDEQRRTEQRIQAPYQSVDGQQRGEEEVAEYDCYPHSLSSPTPRRGHRLQQVSRRAREHGTYQDKQHHGAHPHHLTHSQAQLVAHYLRHRGSSLADGYHATQVVVHCTSKDAPKHYPQICCRTEQNAHDGTEYRPRARYVQELYEEHSPCSHGDVVHPVLLCVARCLQVLLNAEQPAHKGTVKQIPDD